MLCSFRIPGAWSCAWSLNIQANNCFSAGELPRCPGWGRAQTQNAGPVPLPRPRGTLSAHVHLFRLVSASPGDQRSDGTPAVVWDQQWRLDPAVCSHGWLGWGGPNTVSQEGTLCWVGVGFLCVESSPPPSFTGEKRASEVIPGWVRQCWMKFGWSRKAWLSWLSTAS